MRYCLFTLLFAVTVSVFGGEGQNADPSLQELKAISKLLVEIRDELQELRKENKGLREKIEELEKNDDDDVVVGFTHNKFAESNGDIKKLRKLKLPDNPTDEQVEKYIDDIVESSKGQNCYCTDDIQVRLLEKVGSEKLVFLLNALNNPGGNDYYLQCAIKKLAKEEHKNLILDRLPIHADLVEIVADMGWELEAKKILLARLASHPEYLPPKWISLVAGFEDPKSYDDLKYYLIHGGNKSWTYKAIHSLPDIKLDDAVKNMWFRSQFTGPWERTEAAEIAVKYGYVDALKSLIIYMASTNDNNQWGRRETFSVIVSHIEFIGSPKETLKWFRENEKALVFDKEKEKYIVDPEKAKKIAKEQAKAREDETEAAEKAAPKAKTPDDEGETLF